MPSTEPGSAWKSTCALIVIAFAVAICWFVEKRSAPPTPPQVVLPYDPLQPAAK